VQRLLSDGVSEIDAVQAAVDAFRSS